MYVTLGGGAASRQGRIIKHNGFGWVPVRRNDTENQKYEWLAYSSQDDGTPRLHFVTRTSTILQTFQYMEQPNANPLSGVSIPRETTSFIDHPTIDGGMPNTDAIFLQAQVSAKGLSASNANEFINLDYGLDDEARATNDLGDILLGTRAISFVSGAGVGSRTITMRTNLHRDSGGSNLDSPDFRSLEIDYIKDPDTVESWRIIVDLVATSSLTNLPIEQIITNLQAARDLGTLPTFSYANSGTKFVTVFIPEWEEEAWEDSSEGSVAAPNTKAIRRGTVEIILSERI